MANERLKNALNYVIKAAEGKRLGSVRLNKIIASAEIESLDEDGRQMTEAVFIKKEHGPMIRGFREVIAEMVAEGAIRHNIVERDDHDYHDYVSLQPPDEAALGEVGRLRLDKFTREFCERHTARSASEKFHNQRWRISDLDEEMPMGGYFASGPVSIPPEMANELLKNLRAWEASHAQEN